MNCSISNDNGFDFYFHEHKLVIEVDGEIHCNQESIDYDLGRTAKLNNLGIQVIRFTNDQGIYNLDWVIDKIKNVLRN